MSNHLARESSLYLRQHANNPVDWYPWGPEALKRAKELDRPIFLSIGYSACHWCHVMAHESFEDERIGKILNEHFVSIKVDREERPDIDSIYMAAVQALNQGQGGWPMSVFLTPDLRPFTGGTYFPPDDRYGRPGFKRVLLWLADAWRNRREEINNAASDITDVLQGVGRLAPGYVEAYQATGEPSYREVAEETLGWVLREMTGPEGPFYSTLDADSEGVEGKFYVWTAQEIEAVLGKEDAEVFNSVYGVEPEGNWDDPHHPGGGPKNILHRTKTFAQSARLLNVPEAEVRARLDRCRKKLFEVRSRRVWPGRDDKALTSWNGLMIGALAQAAAALDGPRYAEAAARAADFILTRMRTPEGRLLRTWSAGAPAKLNAYLEDYSFLIDGLVSLYEATFEPRWVEAALALADVTVDQFWDDEGGGFFYTGRDHEELIARGKDPHDH